VPGRRVGQLPRPRVEARADHGGELPPAQVVHQAVEASQGLAAIKPFEDVRAERVAQLTHAGGGLHALSHHVADHQVQPVVRAPDGVVPVAAHLGLGAARQIPARHDRFGHPRSGRPVKLEHPAAHLAAALERRV
jgi:hypothetical protein